MPIDRTEIAALLAALGHTLISVATFFVVKHALVHLPWMTVTMLRAAGSGLLLGLLLLTRPASGRPRGADLWKVAALGVLGVTLNQAAYIAGMAESTPSRASLLYATSPLLVLILGWGAGVERLNRQRALGLLLALVGVGLVLSRRPGALEATPRGDAILIFGAICWAAYSALGKPLLEKYDSVSVTAIALLAGTAAFVPIGGPAIYESPPVDAPASVWLAMLWLCVMTSIVAYNLWYYAIRRLPPSRVAVFMNLQPPLTIAASWLFLGEALDGWFLVGAAGVIAGVWMTQKK